MFVGKEPKWLQYVKEGKVNLNISYLMGADDNAPTFPAYGGPLKKVDPPVKTFMGPVVRHAPNLTPAGGYTPPNQPIVIIVETSGVPEPFIKSWMDTFQGSGGLRLSPIKLYEKFAYSEASSLHGAMLQKIQYQRNQAKELLATIQNIKSAIINIESDLEKLREQIDAFSSENWGQIKGLFVDNYGGPDRSWTAAARHVPIVRLALTWFLRLNPPEPVPLKELFPIKIKGKKGRERIEKVKKKIKEACELNKKKMLEQVDQLIKEEKMNPALGNYLKRKLEEFWNWVANYSSWLKTTYDRVKENLIQQKANLKMYMRWAADAIVNAESMTTHPEEFEMGAFAGYLHKFTPGEAMDSEYIFHAGPGSNRPEIWELCKPFVPVVLTKVMVVTSVEVQNKVTDVMFVLYHGYMKSGDFDALSNYIRNRKNDLVNIMIRAGALTEEEAHMIFTEEELRELEGEKEETKLGTKEKMIKVLSDATDKISKFMELFGFSLPKQSLPWSRERRAAAYAAQLAKRGIELFKKSNGMLFISE